MRKFIVILLFTMSYTGYSECKTLLGIGYVEKSCNDKNNCLVLCIKSFMDSANLSNDQFLGDADVATGNKVSFEKVVSFCKELNVVKCKSFSAPKMPGSNRFDIIEVETNK